MPLKLSDDDAPFAEPNVALTLPCGCVNHEAVRLRLPGALSQHIDNPCLRKVVEADLDAEEPRFPLCPDPTCDHHRVKNADGFRSGWALPTGTLFTFNFRPS